MISSAAKAFNVNSNGLANKINTSPGNIENHNT